MKFQNLPKYLILYCLLLSSASGAIEQNSDDFCNVNKATCGEMKKFVGATFWQIGKKWRYAMDRALKPLNITYPQFVLLEAINFLTKDGKKVSQLDVTRIADLDSKGSCDVFRSIEAKKFIKRKPSADGRCINPSLTSLGSKILEQALCLVEKADILFFSEFTKKQINVSKQFHKLIENT